MMSKKVFVISLIIIGLLINGFSFVVRANSSYEDYTTYDETDPNSDFAVTVNTITVSTLLRDTVAYIKDNKGVNYFGDFEHLLDVKITADGQPSMIVCWGITDTSYTHGAMATAGEGIDCFLYRSSVGPYQIYIYDATNDNSDFYEIALNTLYYLTIKRIGTELTCKIYSDSARTDLLDTLSIVCTDNTYSTVLACASWEFAENELSMNAVISNLDLQEPSLEISNPYPENNAIDICPCNDYTSITVGTDGTNNMNLSFYHSFETIDEWFGVSSAELDSYCGDNNGHTLAEALNGTDYWYHEALDVHWFILDLGQTYTIKKVRGRSLHAFDPIDVNIYVSDNKADLGDSVATGITTWQDTTEWIEIDTTDKNGRYIKVEIEATEHGTPGYITFGEVVTPFRIFDVYVTVPSDFHIMEKYYNLTNGTYSFCMCGHSFVPAYITWHDNGTQTVLVAGTWYNITFNESVIHPSKNINHTWDNSNNDTFTILEDGIYNIRYQMLFVDTAVNPTSVIEGRIIQNGNEIHGSLISVETHKQDKLESIGCNVLEQLYYGDKIKLQFTASADTVNLQSHIHYGDIPYSSMIWIERIDDADLHPMHYNETYYWYVNLSEFGNPSNYNVSDVYKFTTVTDASDCEKFTEAEADNLFLSSALSFETPSMLFILWLFLIVVGEWKRDMLYKTLQIPLGVFYGVTLLGSEMWLGLVMICVSIYIGAMSLWEYRKE